MKFEYLAVVSGGTGEDVWDKEVDIIGEDMTLGQALDKIESELESGCTVISIEQID